VIWSRSLANSVIINRANARGLSRRVRSSRTSSASGMVAFMRPNAAGTFMPPVNETLSTMAPVCQVSSHNLGALTWRYDAVRDGVRRPGRLPAAPPGLADGAPSRTSNWPPWLGPRAHHQPAVRLPRRPTARPSSREGSTLPSRPPRPGRNQIARACTRPSPAQVSSAPMIVFVSPPQQ
jgi:hypothetical protein